MKRIVALALASLCLTVAAGAQARVTVNFLDAQDYTDVPISQRQRADMLEAFSEHFLKLGRQLAPTQHLVVDVVDIDLAGRPRGRMTDDEVEEFRVVHSTDWPRMHLRYLLLDGDTVVARGDVQLSDMAFASRLRTYPPNARWPHEFQMIDDWYRATIRPLQVAAR